MILWMLARGTNLIFFFAFVAGAQKKRYVNYSSENVVFHTSMMPRFILLLLPPHFLIFLVFL